MEVANQLTTTVQTQTTAEDDRVVDAGEIGEVTRQKAENNTNNAQLKYLVVDSTATPGPQLEL